MSSTSFADRLVETAETTESILSLGYDPRPHYDSKLPDADGDYDGEVARHEIVTYMQEVADALADENVSPGAFKPNRGYFAQYDNDETENKHGSKALTDVLDIMRDTADVPIILDAKDADIGPSSDAYARAELGQDVDALTVHPEMGSDSVELFFKHAANNGQGVYVLVRTSNPGAQDFQDLPVMDEETGETQPLYEHVADSVVEWSQSYPDGTVGAVVGATSPEELEDLAGKFAGEQIPMLIPGVGAQGGTAEEVMDTLDTAGYDPRLARVNSSSGTMYRAQKDERPREEHADATVEEVKRLNDALSFT